MRKFSALLLFLLATNVQAATDVKDWTFLIYLNGNNSLDSFGPVNLKEMEKVGSTSQINVVVQWASLSAGKTKRLFVTKSSDPTQVNSPILEDMGKVDMGDYHTLVDFVKWGVKNYPAKRYFVNVWNHGGGWHLKQLQLGLSGTGDFHTTDISWDDVSGNHISTEQLGVAMKESAAIIGHKVDIYGSDACLMSMAEVADEMGESVDTFVGSQEVEPGAGWPYDTFLSRWDAIKNSTPRDVGIALTDEYVKSYQGGTHGTQEVTFSAFDLSKMEKINRAVSELGARMMSLKDEDKAKVVTAISQTQTFTYSDYGDLLDFLTLVEKSNLSSMRPDTFTAVREAMKEFIVDNKVTSRYGRATGLSIWLPGTSSAYKAYGERYHGLKFNTHTGWGDALDFLNK